MSKIGTISKDTELGIFDREHHIPYAKTVEVLVDKDGVRSYPIQDLDFFRNYFIIGIVTRQQNATDNRYSKSGYKIITAAQMARAFVVMTQNNNTVHDKIPLEWLIREAPADPGSYAQILIEKEFTAQSSSIEFAGVAALGLAVGETRAVELTFIYLPKSADC